MSARRPKQSGEVGVIISRSSNFTVGGRKDCPSTGRPAAPPKALTYSLRSFTGQVLEGQFVLPGKVCGDLVWGVAVVQSDAGETSLHVVSLKGNAVIFDESDFDTVNGASATVSYLTAK